jgi:predicted RNA binding protein with dsRBD fold (UPF0201 family)
MTPPQPGDDPIGIPYQAEVAIEAPVQPTEVPERVADAVRTLFPDAEISVDEAAITATTHRVDGLADRIQRREIGDAVRDRCLGTLDGDTFELRVRKGPATVDTFNLAVDEAELGDIAIRVTVGDPDPETLIAAMTSPPGDGSAPD